MSGLLPSTPDTSTADDGDPLVVGVDSDTADELLSALSSKTARAVLASLYEDPQSASSVADDVGTSLQNAQYHIRKLEDAGLIEVMDTVYSEKGREMKVFSPAAQPLVVFAGDEEKTSGIKTALTQLLGGVGVLGLAGLIISRLASNGATPDGVPVDLSSGGDSGSAGADLGANQSRATETAGDAAVAGSGNASVTGGTAEPTAAPTPEPTTGGDVGVQDVGSAVEQTETATRTIEETMEPEAMTETVEATQTVAKTIARTVEVTTQKTASPETPVYDVVSKTVEAASGSGLDLTAFTLDPGFLFFAGGVTVLLALIAVQFVMRR